jgi:hypothetical protein
MKPIITNQLCHGALLMALCIGLSGCLIPIGPPKGQVQSRGTITAVNSSDQTIQFQTDAGKTLVVSVVETTDLRKKGEHLVPEKTTLDQIEVGKYLVVQYKTSPEGKLIAIWAVMYKDKSSAPTPPPKYMLIT